MTLSVIITIIMLFLWSIALIYFICESNKIKLTRNINHKLIHNIVIGLSAILPYIIILISLLPDKNLNIYVKITLLMYGLNFFINILETIYLFIKIFNIWQMAIGLGIFVILVFLIGIMFKELLNEYLVYSPYKFAGIIIAIYSLMYNTVSYYSDHYIYEETQNDCLHNKNIKEKKFNLKFIELSILNISILYSIITLLFINLIGLALKTNIEDYKITLNNLFSPTTLTFADVALGIFAVSLFISLVIIIVIRPCMKKYYGYHGNLN